MSMAFGILSVVGPWDSYPQVSNIRQFTYYVMYFHPRPFPSQRADRGVRGVGGCYIPNHIILFLFL